MKVVKQLNGYSKSQIFLMEDREKLFVRKKFDIQRNLERYQELSKLGIRIPKIYNSSEEFYDMEYIPHLDVKNFLLSNNHGKLSNYIENLIKTFSKNTENFDYSDLYTKKISNFDFEKYKLPFDASELFFKLPKILPRSIYHGDLTLENILYDTQKDSFILIDPITTEYDSYVFDIAKLKQDLVCKWFIRNDNFYFDSKLKIILETVEQFKYSDNTLVILMLMRVLPYTKNDKDKNFLINEINKLWK